jgi:WD40 repeat protein
LVAEDEPVTITDIQFVGEDHLLASNENGLRRWHVESDEPTSLYEGHVTGIEVAADDQRVLLVETVKNSDQSRLVVLDLSTGKATPVENHGEYVVQAAFGAASDIVISGGRDGTIRVGHVSSESPFLLLGHEYSVTAIDVDPENRWIASASYDSTIRLWPMPDLSKPPLHTLPREELIVKLKTLTNLRVIRDEESATGWKLTHDPFPGWETVPEW